MSLPSSRRLAPKMLFPLAVSWGFVALGLSCHRTVAQSTGGCVPSSSTFWDEIPALTDELQWSSCYEDGFECARLEVPLDHSEPSVGSLIVALARYPAPLRNNTDLYKGPILFNPGGPGGSGIDLIRAYGRTWSEVFDGRFDIVSFDPRGIGRSGRVSFFETNAERALFNYNPNYDMDFRPDGIAHNWATASIVGKLAVARDNGSLRYINTEQTARDMLNIVEAYGYEKLQYWGFSYGTVLGATFAAMLPDKVERFVLDGVVDSNKWYNELITDSAVDAGKVLQAFFDRCYEAGPNICAFYAPSPGAISDNLDALYAKIREEPVPVVTEDGYYKVIDYPALRFGVLLALYEPYAYFSWLGQALAGLASGSGDIFYSVTRQVPFECSCEAPADIAVASPDGALTVSCNDWPQVPSDLASSVAYVESTQYEFATVFAGLGVACSGWTTSFPKDHFTGPLIANTSHPILFIGNTADPVTSIINARTISEGFAGSVVLTNDGLGHTTLGKSTPCILQNVREYFINGTLPEAGTVCPVDLPLFPPIVAANGTARRGEEDKLEKWSQTFREISGSRRRVGPILGVV